jgi:iron complex outermembrane receptor protein
MSTILNSLKTSAAPLVLGLAMLASPAFAQDKPADAKDKDDANTIVVTGSIIHNLSDTNAASPVSVITSDDIAKRGITTVQGVIQSLASNSGPTLTNSFSANGAFAGGASGASLRGLTTNSTLVLFDGLRAAYYPLADDGSRNFVDLNTIPDEVVDRVEVLRDGASSIYGADAIAGVINIITKKEFKGIQGTAEAGIAQKGYGANQRFSMTAGFGDLASQGYNVYLSAHYIHSDAIYNSQLGAPYNSDVQTGIGGGDNRFNAPSSVPQPYGLSTSFPVFLVRPYDGTNTTALAGSHYQYLNPTTGCGSYPTYTLSDAQYTGSSAPRTVCTVDSTASGGVVEPSITRAGATLHVSANIGADATSYLEFNYEQTKSAYTGYGLAGPGVPIGSVIRANAQPGIYYPRYSSAGAPGGSNSANSAVLALPVYICPRGTVAACTAANGTLNPNNPFAAAGEVARIVGTLPDISQYTASTSRVYRLAGGVDGHFANDWHYKFDATGMINTLDRHFEGYVYIQHLLDEVADGSYNFVNPSLNSAAVRNYLAPTLDANAKSQEFQVQGSIDHAFFDLPGGPLNVAVGGSIRYESVDDPSANSDFNGPTQRYFLINAFGTIGHRWVQSAFFEINAPILDILTLDGSGRYDHYSTGNSHFSPKLGVVFNPIKQLSFHGTISGGFRIPSFGETSSIPTTGYAPYVLPDTFLANFGAGCTSKTLATNCSPYVQAYSIGATNIANPNLKPETSRNITVGTTFKPTRNISFSAEYYNIRKTNAIVSQAFSSVEAAYFANPKGFVAPAGYTIGFNAPDINNPTAPLTIGTIGAAYVNAARIETDGWDFNVNVNLPLGHNGWKFTSMAEAEYIHKLNTTFADGHTEHYAGTSGNYNLTAGTGTPHWKGTWQNTLTFGAAGSITATAYYTGGYNLSAEDQGGVAGDCGLGADALGYGPCNVRRYIQVDMNATLNVAENFTFYVNVLNAFGARAPLDTATYGAYLYNPSIAEQGALGRAFNAGVKVKF